MTAKIIAGNTNHAGVKGKSIINHRIRCKLSLSMDEYIACDYIFQTNQKPLQPQNFDTCWKLIGMDSSFVRQMTLNLINKGLMITDKLDRYKTTDTWDKEFGFDADFDEFWEIYRKHGNKATAKALYSRVRKMIDKDELHEKARKYVTWVLEKRKEMAYGHSAQTWLAPDKERWNDILPGSDSQQNVVYQGTMIKITNKPTTDVRREQQVPPDIDEF